MTGDIGGSGENESAVCFCAVCRAVFPKVRLRLRGWISALLVEGEIIKVYLSRPELEITYFMPCRLRVCVVFFSFASGGESCLAKQDLLLGGLMTRIMETIT